MKTPGETLIPVGFKYGSKRKLRRDIDRLVAEYVNLAVFPLKERLALFENLRFHLCEYLSWLDGEGELSLSLQNELWGKVKEAVNGLKTKQEKDCAD